MDKSLDQLIKENPKKFSLKGRNQQRRNNVTNKGAVGKAAALAAKKADATRVGGKKNLTGRVTKKGAHGGQPTKVILKKKINQLNTKKMGVVAGGRVVDARNKLLAKNRLKIKDARDKLADITKKSTADLRQKLLQKRPNAVKKMITLKTNQNLKSVRGVGNSTNPITRTILSRTVENEFARQQFSSTMPHFTVTPINTRYQPPPPHQYYHPYAEPALTFKHSTAAMDMEPPLPASRRIRPTDKRLGPREEIKRPDAGYRVYVDNLHHKVTQEDIFELFGDIGPLVKATLQRPGMAEVVYTRREDALRAVDVYHNRQLDGLPMHCTLATSYDGRQENDAPVKMRSQPSGGKSSSVAPDINTIHKALFNKASSNAQIFTVTLPKKT